MERIRWLLTAQYEKEIRVLTLLLQAGECLDVVQVREYGRLKRREEVLELERDGDGVSYPF